MSDASTRTRNRVSAFGFILIVGVAAVAIVNGTDDTFSPQSEGSNASSPTATTVSADAETADLDRFEVEDEIDNHRRELRMAATSANANITSLRLYTADAIVGDGREPNDLRTVIDERVVALIDAADDLENAADAIDADPDSTGENDLDVAASRLETLRTRAPQVTDEIRAAATDTQDLTDAAIALHVAAADYTEAAASTSDSTEVDDLRNDWQDERARLNDYHKAANAATQHESIAEHARAHRALVEELAAIADEAIADLEDNDLDAYNDRLNSHLEQVDDLIEDIDRTLGDALDAAVASLEQAENRMLGLLADLDQVRVDLNVW